MKTPRIVLSVFALLTLSCQVHANKSSPMVGTPIEHVSSQKTFDSGLRDTSNGNRSAEPVIAFQLTPPETVRETLQRWANQAGWTFGPEFYSIPADYSVAKPESLGTDFKAAVRALLDSTSMSEVPAQPCFYANQVLRVVPRHELCTRP